MIYSEQTRDKFQILSGSSLKFIAIITMLIDHLAIFMVREFDFMTISLFSALGKDVSVYFILRKIGRLAFPLFCFLITEGFIHTKNKKKYGISLLSFAFISEIPYDLFVHNQLFFIEKQNVFFTLLLGYIALVILESNKPEKIKYPLTVCPVILSVLLHVDYGMSGVLLIIFLYCLRNQLFLRALLALPFLSGGYAAWCAFLPIGMYNGKRGFVKGTFSKYLFYAFYPIHLILLYVASMIIR